MPTIFILFLELIVLQISLIFTDGNLGTNISPPIWFFNAKRTVLIPSSKEIRNLVILTSVTGKNL